MQRITVYEHQDLLVAPKGRLSRAVRDDLLRAAERLPHGAITPIHEGIRTGSFCGLVQAGDCVIEILPKIYASERHAPNRGLLVHMLATCLDVPVLRAGAAETANAQDLLTVIVRCFLDEAVAQFKKGPVKKYQEREDRLSRPRGRLNLSQQVRRGRAAVHALHCEFDELTADNLYNQCVHAALNVVPARLLTDAGLRIKAEMLRAWLSEVQSPRFTAEDVLALRPDRLTHRYQYLLRLTAWLLQLKGPDVRGGGQQGLALLFDMNRLFESYVARRLDSAIRRSALRGRLRLREQGPGRYLLRDADGQSRFLMRPDLVLQLDGRTRAILDTKWKNLDPAADPGKAGVSQTDLYQLLAYGHSYDCAQLYLVYPHSAQTAGWEGADYRFPSSGGHGYGLGIRLFDIVDADVSARGLYQELVADIEPGAAIDEG